jgi:hypothetical protein
MVAYQDISDNTQGIVSDLSNTDLPELMAMVLVFASISLMLYMVYKITIVIKTPKAKMNADDNEENEKAALINVLNQMVSRLQAMDDISGTLTKTQEAMAILVANINKGSEQSSQQHRDFAEITNQLKREVQTGLDKVAKATNDMTDQLKPVIDNLLEELAKDRQISIKDKQDIADSVVSGLSSSLVDLWQKNKAEVINLLSVEIANELSKKATQETPKVEPKKPKTETVVAPIQPPKEAKVQDNEHENNS